MLSRLSKVLKMETLLLALSIIFSPFTQASITSDKPKHEQQYLLSKFDKVKEDIYYAAEKANFDPYTLTAIASAESGFNPGAVNNSVKGNKPKGMLQYMPGTWNNDRKLYHKEMGVSSNASVLNQRANLLIGAKSLAVTKDSFIKNTHLTARTIQPGDYYLSHFLGHRRALQVINSKSNTPLTKFMSMKGINANYTLTRAGGKRNGRILTTGELRVHLNRHVLKHASIYSNEIRNDQMDKLITKIDNKEITKEIAYKPLRMKPMDI